MLHLLEAYFELIMPVLVKCILTNGFAVSLCGTCTVTHIGVIKI